MSTKAEQLEWRRSKVSELRSRGLSYAEISSQLQVSRTCIASDLQYIRQQAKGAIKEYVTEHLPEQYHLCLTALDTVLKNAFEIMEKSEDDHDKLQALELFKDTHLQKLELLSDAGVIEHALHFIKTKGQQQHDEKKEDKKAIRDENVSNVGAVREGQAETEKGTEIAF